MNKYLSYLEFLLRHKYYVFVACMKFNVPLWQAITHDVSKFLPDEFIPYANSHRESATGEFYYAESEELQQAWNLHLKRNKHHWQYYIVLNYGKTIILRMPDWYVRELISDWEGASKAKRNNFNPRTWYLENYKDIKMHPESKWLLEKLLVENYPLEQENT